MLPSRLRRRVSAVADYTVPVPPDSPPPAVDAAVLTTLASACRDHERLRLDYRTHDGTSAVRSVEPHRLVSWGMKWYLLGWDTDRGDWRTFRVDRIRPRTPAGPRFTPRDLPDGGDVAAYVARGVSRAGFRFRARVTVQLPAAVLADRLPPAVGGVIEAIDDQSCVLACGADSVHSLVVYLGLLDADFTVTEPPELVARLRVLAGRYQRAVNFAPPGAL